MINCNGFHSLAVPVVAAVCADFGFHSKGFYSLMKKLRFRKAFKGNFKALNLKPHKFQSFPQEYHRNIAKKHELSKVF